MKMKGSEKNEAKLRSKFVISKKSLEAQKLICN